MKSLEENVNKQIEASRLPQTSPGINVINEALRSSEERFKAIINQSNIGIAECDVKGKFIFVSKRFANITGYEEEQLHAMHIQSLVPLQDAQHFNELLNQLLNKGDAFEEEMQLLRADGSAVWLVNHSSRLLDVYGKFVSFIVTINIISRKNEAKTNRPEADKSFDILESITDAFFAVNSNWQFTYINRKAEELNNRAHGSLLGKVLWEEFPALIGSEYGDLYETVMKQKTACSTTAVSLVDNQWYEAHAFPSKDGIVAYFKNISEQKKAELALQKSEESLRTLFNTIDEGFCIIEVLFDDNNKPYNYRFLEYNSLFEEMSGLHGALGKTILDFVPNLKPVWFETFAKVARTGESVRFEDSNGKMNEWFTIYASRVDDETMHKIALVFSNITQRKLIERDRERFLALGSDLQAIGYGNAPFIWVSSAWERVLGYTFEEMTSLHWTYFVHPDDLEKTIAAANKNISGEEMVAWENRYRHKNGSYRWFSWNSKPYLDEGCTYGVATDITVRKEAEEALKESEERYSAIIHQATAGVIEMNLDGKHIFVNKKWCEITGFSEEELYALTAFDYVHPDDVDHCRQIFQQTAATGKPFIREKRIFCKDKTELWINETISGISDAQHKIKSVVSVCIDITDRKTIEKQKDEFIGVASHELKTPVTSLKAFAQVLQMRFAQSGDHQSAAMLQKMESQINRLTTLVLDLLDVTRVEGGLMAFRREVFDFSAMITHTTEEVQRVLSSQTIVCKPLPQVYVFADMERTSQVLVNFLTNAAKYSPNASTVVVSAFITGSYINCSVEDFGIGIPAESYKYIFDRFYRVRDSSRNTYPGLGLGLYISSEIVKKQGGDISFTSTVNKGSVFSFRLPLYTQS